MDQTAERVVRIETKQREICRRLVKLEEGDEGTRNRFDAVHSRITKLQVRVAFYAGGAAAAGGLLGTLVGWALQSGG